MPTDGNFKVVPWIISTLLLLVITFASLYNTFVIKTFEKGIDKNQERCEACEETNKKQEQSIAELDKGIALVDAKVENHLDRHKDKKKDQ